MRYVIKFTKGENIKFIGHLDLMRTIQRIIKRSGLPVEYSKGFNPHMSLSIAQPLSVGVYSDGEYLDLVLTESLGVGEVIEKLNASSSKGSFRVTKTQSSKMKKYLKSEYENTVQGK